jgi:hypothetical protein
MSTTTTTTPIPTEFKCWDNEIPRVYPLIHPWPCCGVEEMPSAIFGSVTYSGEDCKDSDGNALKSKDVIWTRKSPCIKDGGTLDFYAFDVPIALHYNHPCWTSSKFYPSINIIGFSSNSSPISAIKSGCNYSSGKWNFYGSATFVLVSKTVYGPEGIRQVPTCTITATINGVA